MQILKITFDFISPLVFTDLPVFDAILAYAKFLEGKKLWEWQSITGSDFREVEIPLKKHPSGFYFASYLFWEDGAHIEGMDSWKKRWANEYDYLADFGKNKRKIAVGSGQFRNYSMPLIIHSIKKGWFYFVGNINEVDRLIRNNLIGIGKKVSMGFGWFRDFKIEEIGPTNLIYFRPLPGDFDISEIDGIRYRKGFGSYKIPYWMGENQEIINIPEKILEAC